MTATTGASVLVIDDEPGMRDMLAYELSQEGFDVETVEGGMAAIDAMRRRRFDLAITDLKMPGMDGVQTVEALRTIDPDIEVIVATGYATVETAVACMKHGAYDYIQKPYDLDELRLLLDRAMEKSHLQGVVALYEASRLLLSTLEYDKLIPLILDLAGRVLNADATEIIMADAESAQSSPCSLNIVPHEPLLALANASLATGAALRIPDPVHAIPESLSDAGFGAVLVVPLLNQQQSIGHLFLLRSANAPCFSESELRRAAIFGSQVALSIDNVRLYEDLAGKIDELKATREQLVQTEKLAVASRLASSLAHEINNPLAYMRANLEALRDYSSTVGGLWLATKEIAMSLRQGGQPRDALSQLERFVGSDETDRMIQDVAEVIDDILEGVRRIADLVAGFSGLSEPLEPGTPSEFEVGQILQECARIRPSLFTSGRKVQVAGNVARAWAAADDTRTAVLNLLVFLQKRYTTSVEDGTGEAIVLSCMNEEGRAVATIYDPSLLLSSEERLRVFEPSVCIDNLQGHTLRLDIGLCLAQHLVQRNGGRLVVTPQKKGTLFRLELPSGRT